MAPSRRTSSTTADSSRSRRLAGLRVEDQQVFDDTHREIGRWLSEGLVDGLRVDHPDGLRDPGQYLERLRDLAGDARSGSRRSSRATSGCPTGPSQGTTGYDALGTIDRVFVDPSGEGPLTALAGELDDREENRDWVELVHRRKRAVADGILRSEVLRWSRELGEGTDEETADAVAELAAWFPVYRSYLPFGAEHLEEARRAAAESRPDLAPRDRPRSPTALGVTAFEQTTGAIMAKGVEDNAFYRFTRLTSLTEVGGDPSEFALSPEEFHRRQEDRQRRLPESMTALTTHDTKRGEDTRARIAVLAELPGRFERFLADRARARRLRRRLPGEPALAGRRRRVAGVPRAAAGLRAQGGARGRRIHRMDRPATSGSRSAWPRLIDAAFDDERVRAEVEALAAVIDAPGASNGLGAKLLQLTRAGATGRLPGLRALGAVARRPGQPPTGRVRRVRRPARAHRRGMAARGRLVRRRQGAGHLPRAAAAARPAGAVHRLPPGLRRGLARRPPRRLRPRRRDRAGHPAAGRPLRHRRLGATRPSTSGTNPARRTDRPGASRPRAAADRVRAVPGRPAGGGAMTGGSWGERPLPGLGADGAKRWTS